MGEEEASQLGENCLDLALLVVGERRREENFVGHVEIALLLARVEGHSFPFEFSHRLRFCDALTITLHHHNL